ncbi:hypothetical protein E2562_036299, partial [Oryza meyeriana var. granulata]
YSYDYYNFTIDQAPAMASAISILMPQTTHTWCKWHVLKDIKKHLGHVYIRHRDFKKDFNMVVNHMFTIDEFERAWAWLLDTYELHGNEWLIGVYEKREMWAKPYFAGTFCARMTSTQRSECANRMVKSYVPYAKLIHQREEDDDEQQKNNSQVGSIH